MKRFGFLMAVLGGIFISFVGVNFALSALDGEATVDVLKRTYGLGESEYYSLVLGLLFYATMLAGIALGQLFQEVVAKPDEQVRLRELMRTLNKGRSWAAMLASPIVFFSTVPSLLALGAGAVAFFYALQNGFFCLAVFNAISAKFTSSTQRAA